MERELERLEKQIARLRSGDETSPPPLDPMEFCAKILRFKPTGYPGEFPQR